VLRAICAGIAFGLYTLLIKLLGASWTYLLIFNSDPRELVIFEVNMPVSVPEGGFFAVIMCVTTLASKDSETSYRNSDLVGVQLYKDERWLKDIPLRIARFVVLVFQHFSRLHPSKILSRWAIPPLCCFAFLQDGYYSTSAILFEVLPWFLMNLIALRAGTKCGTW